MDRISELKAKSIRLRLVTIDDAEFILSLRSDARYNKYLSKVNTDIQSQIEWILKYKDEEKSKKQFYFIIERLDGTPCGTVRIYDIKGDSFCWGSWILNQNKTALSAVESALLVYKFGFEVLGYRRSHFDVMKGNKKVIDFHKKFGALETGMDDENIYFEIYPDAVMEMSSKFLNDK
ncbi:GNAT family N-acetyltransferase [Aeromonas salmonicida]|uniref:GNAT family N-acetyltransferase n=1 Tax=Aeromonas salmonicida TaxID=645 RepID=UPI0022406875|nr:GNAT family N-acetyltransferase [Aeromonas salmonicida]